MTRSELNGYLRQLAKNPKLRHKIHHLVISTSASGHAKNLRAEGIKVDKDDIKDFKKAPKDSNALSLPDAKSVFIVPKNISNIKHLRNIIGHEYFHSKNPLSLGSLETPAWFMGGYSEHDNPIKGLLTGMRKAISVNIDPHFHRAYGGWGGKIDRIKEFITD
jgi:hypothetical protein